MFISMFSKIKENFTADNNEQIAEASVKPLEAIRLTMRTYMYSKFVCDQVLTVHVWTSPSEFTAAFL